MNDATIIFRTDMLNNILKFFDDFSIFEKVRAQKGKQTDRQF